jgi:hypothetical protein
MCDLRVLLDRCFQAAGDVNFCQQASRLVDGHGFDARYASVRRFVQKLRRTVPEPAVITTAPGEESRVGLRR